MKNMEHGKFIENLFRSVGGIVTDFGDYCEVDLASDFKDKLGFGNPIRYTFDDEVAQAQRDIYYAVRGTPFFKKLLHVYGQNTSVTKGFIPSKGVNLKSALPHLEKFLVGRDYGEFVLQESREVYIPKIEIQYHLNVKSHRSQSLISREVFDIIDLNPIAHFPENLKWQKTNTAGFEEISYQENIIPVFLNILKTIEGGVKDQVETSFQTNQRDFENDKRLVNEFYELIKEELEERKESLYYHLYFFQKEEKINKIIMEQEEEWDLKLKINQLKYRYKAFLDIYNAFIYYFPALELKVQFGGKESPVPFYFDQVLEKIIVPKTKKARLKKVTKTPLKKSA